MSLPTNKIKKVKLPNNAVYEIIPEKLQNSGHELTPPTLTQDSTIALASDIENSTITLTQGGVTKGSFTLNQSSDATISLDAGGGSIDYNKLENIPIVNINGTGKFEMGQTFVNGDKVYFDTTKTTEVNTLLTNLNYTGDGGILEGLVAGQDKFGILAYNLTSMDLGYVLMVSDYLNEERYTVVYGTQSGSIEGGITWTQGWNNLSQDGSFTLSLRNDETVVLLSEQAGWNGNLISTTGDFSQDYDEGVYYRDASSGQSSGAIYRYVDGGLKKVLVEGDVQATNVVDGGTINIQQLYTNGSTSYTMPSSVFNTLCDSTYNTILKLHGTYYSATYTLYFNVKALTESSGATLLEVVGIVGTTESFYFSGGFSQDSLTKTLTMTSKGIEDFDDYLLNYNPTGTGALSLNRKENTTIGSNSVAVGYSTTASGMYSHAEGNSTTASLEAAHAEGVNTTASGMYSHAEGASTEASSYASHAEGTGTIASGYYSHAEGSGTIASGLASHAEGEGTIANHAYQHVFGEYNIEDPSVDGSDSRGTYVELVGNGTADNARSNARTLDWNGNETLSGNLRAAGLTDGTTTKTMTEVLAGGPNITISSSGVTDGTNTYNASDKMNKSNPTGTGSLSMNRAMMTTIGDYSTTLGSSNTAAGNYTLAEGYTTGAFGNYSHAEGMGTTALDGGHAEGSGKSTSSTFKLTGDANSKSYTIASGVAPKVGTILSYGYGTNQKVARVNIVSSTGTTINVSSTLSSSALSSATVNVCSGASYGISHAEGYRTIASNDGAHAEGSNTFASGTNSHAEGSSTTASGTNSHAEGLGTIASSQYQHVSGKYNIEDTTSTYAEIIGNGTSSAHSNARTLDWNGNEVLAGNIKLGNHTTITNNSSSDITVTLPSSAGTLALVSDIPTKTSDLTNDSGFLTAAPTNMVTTDTAQTVSGTKTLTGGLKVSGRSVGSGDDEGIVVGVASNNYAGVCCGSPSGRRAVFYLKPSATSGNSVWRYNNGSTTYDIAHPEKAGTIALTSDIPSAVTESTVSGWGFTKNAGTITGVQLNGTTVASSGVANVQALPNFSLNISHQTAGNPRPVKFLTVNYNTAATYFKMSATSCHDNGTSYQFLEDIIIGCTTGGTVVCNVYKYCQQAVTYDGATRNYGDVFYVIDTTNKKVDFFILCGQWASSQFTPATKIGNTTIAYITQHTGTATYYSSGTKVWASGDSTTYARLSDIPDTSGLMPKSGGTFTGSVSAPSFYATSDRRLKENIKPAELDCGKVIDDLQIKEFNFIDDEDKKVVVGAIAQELQEILPEKYKAELVSGSEDTHYSINEGKLLFVAIGALKEERAKTKELEERLARIEAKLEV